MTPAEHAYTMSAAAAHDADDLVMQELSQVYYIAARIRERLPQHVELEDLVSAGVIGLLEARRSFDSTRNAQFKTFAKFRIRGAILDSLREIDAGSRLLRRRGREIAEATARLEARLGRHPSETDIAAFRSALKGHEREESPFSKALPRSVAQFATFCSPTLAVDIRYSAWTKGGRLLDPKWHGIRPDKDLFNRSGSA